MAYGRKTGGGSRKGKPNKSTAGIRELARSFVDDPQYREALKARLAEGTAGAMETMLWAYAYGRPVTDVPGDGQAPSTRITISF